MQPLLARAIPLAAAVVLGCRAPTQVTVEVSTDVPCAELRGVTLTVGEPGALEALSPTTATDACAQGDPRSRVGSIVVVPSDEIDDAFGLRIVGGVDGEADACAAPDYAGCIVARREMRFVPHTELYLPVVLRGSCKDVPCDATTTCVLGECVPAVVIDPGACVDPEACGEGSLGGGAGGAGGAGGGAGGSGGSGGEGGGALLPQAECGRPSVLTDDFNDGVKASSWRAVVSPGGASSESGGRLSLTPPPGAQGEAAYRSFHAVNFDEDLIRVEATGLDTNPAAYAAMSAELGPGRRIAIEQRGTLLWSRLVDVVSDNSDVTNYDPVQHRFWQIREASGTLTWETSPDGVTWTTRKTAPTPGFAGTVHVALAAGADQPIAAPLGAHFEDFNRVRTPAVWCPASSFTDDFEDGQEGIAWSASQSTGDCTRSEGGGNAHFNMPGNGASMCKYQTSTAFDLTDSWIAVDVPAITYFDAPMSVFLAAEDDRQNRLEFGFDGASGFYMEVAAAGGPPARETAPYVQAERWWRIRAEAGSILFEASQDGAIWDLKRKVDTPFPITAMHARFGVRTTGAMSTPNVGIGVPSYNGL